MEMEGSFSPVETLGAVYNVAAAQISDDCACPSVKHISRMRDWCKYFLFFILLFMSEVSGPHGSFEYINSKFNLKRRVGFNSFCPGTTTGWYRIIDSGLGLVDSVINLLQI
jgi:hypothetical protein